MRWAVTNCYPLKDVHLAGHPHVAFSWWSPAQDLAYADCDASWVEDQAEKQAVWELFLTTPPPLGYDLRAFGVSGPQSPSFMPLRLDPLRVRVLRVQGWGSDLTPRLWNVDRTDSPAAAQAAGNGVGVVSCVAGADA